MIGIDQDPRALERTKARLGKSDNMILIKGNFRDLKLLLHELAIEFVDGILIDLGIILPIG